ncbi:GNAT family N-acetyltransferase [Paenibacillus segetis]|uniref:N-acetyltransferase domain-containing protein n=1 Tax=Paenibacillus segetis TaxID=1325360 RepID=A0ABQ1YRZ6_9BACL|nr:hypothetical protein [Paenibacillus segetis]GGH34267.1 hypothetical protein GCM10008013_39900 [Paenibacillus segetis]
MDTILHSDRLVLKVLDESHVEAVLNFVQRNRSYHEPWGPLRDPDYYTIQDQRNGASLRIAEKLGFYHEGLAPKYLKINGVWEDHIHMVLRNESME